MGKGIKVVIADSTDSFRELLSELIDSEEDMEVAARASDGKEALELVQKLKPDVLVTELMLREMEGLSLIRSLRELDALPHTIVVSGFFNDHLAETVSHLGVEYFFPKPCRLTGLVERIRDCVSDTGDSMADLALDKLAGKYVQSFGILPHLSGHKYLRTAVVLITSGRCPMRGVTKILYPELAKMFGSTARRVERCIRHAIQTGWDEGDRIERNRCFGSVFGSFDSAPTNSELLAILVERVCDELAGWEKQTF